MSVTSGFFNSLNHDRRYNAQQMSAIFDGIINDGVFANIGVAFAITADSGVTINIGVGKAWFNSAWVYNDALLPKTLEGSEVVLDRIDAVVIEVDHNESVRMGDIKIVKGTPSSSPKNPTMANETKKHQYPLAYIYRKAGSTEITQADITNMVGTSSCPYITGILQVQNIDNIVAQWEGQWNQWYSEIVSNAGTEASELMAELKSEFDIWFADVQALLEDDVATTLAAQVAALQGKFDDLLRDRCVYDTIEDATLDAILGSDGTPLQGKTVLGGGGSAEDIDLSDYAKKKDLEAVAESKLDRTEKFARNLLDNSDFTNPVNQRGIVSGNVESQTYFVDRWIVSGDSKQIYVNMDNLKRGIGFAPVSGNEVILTQRLLKGVIDEKKKYTVAYKNINDVIVVSTAQFVTDATSYDEINFTISKGTFIKWFALYEGEYTAETLPEYRPKGYGVELYECMRYYQHYASGDINTIGTAATQYHYARLMLPVEMRVAPTMADAATFDVHINDAESEGGRVMSMFAATKRRVVLRAAGEVRYTNTRITLCANTSAVKLSADL